MSWLGGKRIAAEVARSIGLADGHRVAVGFDVQLASRLAAAGASVTFVSDVDRDVARATTASIHVANLEELASFDGAVLVGAASRDDRTKIVSAFAAQVRDGCRIALVDRVQRHVAAKAALVGGLSRLEQRSVGRSVVTVGRWFAGPGRDAE